MEPHERIQEKLMILINFKRVSGDKAIRLATDLDTIDKKIREFFDIVIALQPRDALQADGNISLPIFIQDGFAGDGDQFLDGIDYSHLTQSNVRGIILNHPEKTVPLQMLEDRCQAVKSWGMETLMCTTSLEEGIEINNRFQPKYIAVENKALIGKDISICDHCPELVDEALQTIDNRILFGGGIRTPKDIHLVSVKGGSGVLISSLVIKSPNPSQTLAELLIPLIKN